MTLSNLKSLSFIVAALMLAGCSGPQAHTQESENRTSQETQVVPPAPEKVMDRALTDENNIYFTAGTTTVDQEGKDKLRQHAQNLKQNPRKMLILTAHADDSGSRNYNLAIAEERHMAVFKLLRSYGAPAKQIRRNRVNSARKQQICLSADCQLQIRRVELVYPP
ncbi:MAG: OmpA family protein [Propionivibrio sp.]|uniref:OmpA family protein n=1 Tax=Propionivibrio sp. TaxID=2212460 RepID=UPI001A5CCC53|nr:OmpA family protein [Propionivibrio sp.]MBL8413873.1 OmpA family protein [Propionivibrio sp.]